MLFAYTGRERDDETGLYYYYRARYYDPAVGRFVSEDPLAFVAGDTNLYRYVSNTPLNSVDPSGLQQKSSGWTRFWGGLQTIGGLLQAAGGAGFALITAETGVGVVAGAAVAVKGVDNLQAGIRQLWTGQATNTLTYEAIQNVTGSDKIAFIANIGTDLVGIGVQAKGLKSIVDVARGVTANSIANLNRTGSALKTDPYHAFPDIVDNFASGAKATKLSNGATLRQIEGSLNGVAGRFEWIVDGGSVTHRLFIRGGTLNGIPIKP